MSRIVLATMGSLGDLHPMIAIGLELRRRGHHPVFCTSSFYRSKLESLGFEFASLRPDITPDANTMSRLVKEIMNPNTGAERLLRGFLFPAVESTYQDLLRAVTSPPGAELLVSAELIYAAPLVAEKTGVPWASAITAPLSFFSYHDLPTLPPFPRLSAYMRRRSLATRRRLIAFVKWFTRNWAKPIQQLRRKLSLPPGNDPIHEGKFSPHLVLAMFSAGFAPPQPDWPPNTVATGFPFYDGEAHDQGMTDEMARFLQAGSPPIVFTLGSAAVMDPGEFYQESAQAARLLQRRAVLLLGQNQPPAELPPGVIGCSYVRFSELFARAAALVHQGGIGTTGQALRAGKPMLVMPYGFDQPDNAARLVRLGVGQVLTRHQYKAPRVAAELRTLLEKPEYARSVLTISQRIQAEQGAATACDALELLLPRNPGRQTQSDCAAEKLSP